MVRFPEVRSDAKHISLKLRQLVASFFELPPDAPQPNPAGYVNWTTRRLDDELCALAARTGALSAIVIDFQSPVLWGTSEPRVGDVRDSQADIGKAQRLLGYVPRVSFEEGLAQTIAWWRTPSIALG